MADLTVEHVNAADTWAKSLFDGQLPQQYYKLTSVSLTLGAGFFLDVTLVLTWGEDRRQSAIRQAGLERPGSRPLPTPERLLEELRRQATTRIQSYAATFDKVDAYELQPPNKISLTIGVSFDLGPVMADLSVEADWSHN